LRTPPNCSGSDVVGAATMPPLGAYVRALSVTRERFTASPYAPWYVDRLDHSVHHVVVCSTNSNASLSCGACSYDGCHASVNATRSPADTVKLATVVKSRLSTGTVVIKVKASGPPM
jgi:hypothetical protein